MRIDYTAIQDEIIARYRVDLCDGTRCDDGDSDRTHAHPELRRVCKWKRANSIRSTFTLLHEVGHIETTTPKMRRAEEEYHATVWAIDRCHEYGIEVPLKILFIYQRYIILEIERGKRRGGRNYGDLNLYAYAGHPEFTLKDIYNACDVKWKRFIDGNW